MSCPSGEGREDINHQDFSKYPNTKEQWPQCRAEVNLAEDISSVQLTQCDFQMGSMFLGGWGMGLTTETNSADALVPDKMGKGLIWGLSSVL